jgi:DNA-binding XRE family transcriptional regulator
MHTFPSLPGPVFKKLREDLGISRAQMAKHSGLSESTISRQEAHSGPIGRDLAEAVAPYFVSDYEAGIDLGLTVKAIALAQKHGLRAAEVLGGKLMWRPTVHEWASKFRRRFPSSLESQALDLCERLGISDEEGILRCSVCELREIEPARIALRQCTICQIPLCSQDRCGDYFIPNEHDHRRAMPVACSGCLIRHRLLRNSAVEFVPGSGSLADQLAARLEDIWKSPDVGQREKLASVIRKTHRAAVERHEAIQAALDAEGVIADPGERPDFFLNLRSALAEATRDVLTFQRLVTHVENALAVESKTKRKK